MLIISALLKYPVQNEQRKRCKSVECHKLWRDAIKQKKKSKRQKFIDCINFLLHKNIAIGFIFVAQSFYYVPSVSQVEVLDTKNNLDLITHTLFLFLNLFVYFSFVCIRRYIHFFFFFAHYNIYSIKDLQVL